MAFSRPNVRNALGLKDSINCYRTFNGVRFVMWSVKMDDDHSGRLQRQGVRCRTRGDEIYIHPDDLALADKIDNP